MGLGIYVPTQNVNALGRLQDVGVRVDSGTETEVPRFALAHSPKTI